MITLDDSQFFAKGGERKCFVHPEDASKLIKIQYDNSLGRNQNTLDLHYYNHLKQRVSDFSGIANFHGQVETNLGGGLVFDIVRNYDGKLAQTFEDMVRKSFFSSQQEMSLLEELQQYLTKHLIVFGDVVLSNILCQEYAKNAFKLIIVDGLGARRFNFKLWLQNRSNAYAKIRINMQYEKLLLKYQQIKAQS